MTEYDIKTDYFCLSQNLTVRAMPDVQRDMLRLIDQNNSIDLAFPDDCQVDISLIQLVEAARIYTGTAGKRIRLARPASGPVLDVLQRSGVLEGLSAEDAKFWLHQGGIQ